MPSRHLRQSEIDLARLVFRDQVPYDRVHIASYYLPGNDGTPVTMASASSRASPASPAASSTAHRSMRSLMVGTSSRW